MSQVNKNALRPQDLLGRMYESQGETWMVVALEGDQVVVQNEDERTKRVRLDSLLRLVTR